MDLVEVSSNSNPPVCKLFDYGKYKYEKKKIEQKHRQKQKTKSIKGIRLSLRISEHDFNTKVKQAQRFLQKKHKVKVALEFKGREITRQGLGRDILEKFSSKLTDYSEIEQKATREMNTLIMILAPK